MLIFGSSSVSQILHLNKKFFHPLFHSCFYSWQLLASKRTSVLWSGVMGWSLVLLAPVDETWLELEASMFFS